MIDLCTQPLKQGAITSGASLGYNSLGRQDDQGGIPSETEEEDGDFHCSDECDPFGTETFKVWRQATLSRVRETEHQQALRALRKRHLPETLGETHRVAGRKYPRRGSGELCEVHQGKRERLDPMGTGAAEHVCIAVQGYEHPEEDGADQGDDTLRCEEDISDSTVPYSKSGGLTKYFNGYDNQTIVWMDDPCPIETRTQEMATIFKNVVGSSGPCQVEIKFGAMQFDSHLIIITTNVPPDHMAESFGSFSNEAMYRRFIYYTHGASLLPGQSHVQPTQKVPRQSHCSKSQRCF